MSDSLEVAAVHVLSLAFSLIGISLGWLPGIGWLGFAISAAAVVLGVRGISDRRTGPAGCGYDTAGNLIGGFSLPWIVAFQIKHAGEALDALLVPWSLERLIAIAAAAVLVFWVAQIAGRWRARAAFVAVALAAALVFTTAGASAWTLCDREPAPARAQADASNPSPR
ncbi:MAG: hypothetical protein M0R80_13005 [Proteobacteria bacterium]|nr:hypothetical protein [Pseudomonadota bacterium]